MAAKRDRTATERRAAARTPGKAQTPSFTGNARAEVSADELRKLISEAAYYRAKRRGFAPGHELEDWIQAEAEVMRRLNGPRRAA